MKPEEIQKGKQYRGKKFEGTATRNNDRSVIWISPNRFELQYDSDTVGIGRKRPIVTVEAFAKWAARELTAEEIAAYEKG